MSISTRGTKTVIKVGGQTITKFDGSARQAQAMANHLFPEMSKILDGSMGPVFAEGIRQWPRGGDRAHPRATGRSFAGFDYRKAHLNSDGALVTSVTNPTVNPKDAFPYVYVIRTSKTRGKTIWNVYFSKPFKKQTKAMIDKMTDEYRRLLDV